MPPFLCKCPPLFSARNGTSIFSTALKRGWMMKTFPSMSAHASPSSSVPPSNAYCDALLPSVGKFPFYFSPFSRSAGSAAEQVEIWCPVQGRFSGDDAPGGVSLLPFSLGSNYFYKLPHQYWKTAKSSFFISKSQMHVSLLWWLFIGLCES